MAKKVKTFWLAREDGFSARLNDVALFADHPIREKDGKYVCWQSAHGPFLEYLCAAGIRRVTGFLIPSGKCYEFRVVAVKPKRTKSGARRQHS